MIKNEIVLKPEWNRVDRLIEKLLFIRDSHFALRNIRDEVEKEDGLLHYVYTDMRKKEDIDEYFADDANRLIIDYINGEES